MITHTEMSSATWTSNETSKTLVEDVPTGESTSLPRLAPKKKRQRRHNLEDTTSDEEDDDRENPKRRKGRDDSRKPLACPFMKRDPIKYQACHSIKLLEIRYVKQHLLRKHRQPIHCPKCGRTFDTCEGRDQHIRQRACEASLVEMEGISEDTERRLKSRFAYGKMSLEEKWFLFWHILFPDLPRPLSPFLDTDDTGEIQLFRHYCWQRSITTGTDEFLVLDRLFDEWFAHKRSTVGPSERPPRPGPGIQESGFSEFDGPLNLPSYNGSRSSRLACPYFKRNPQRYCDSRCCGPGWDTVHRVKEHLYRCHAKPISCPRCNLTFPDVESQMEHLTANERCEIQPIASEFEGFDAAQEKLLRKKMRGTKSEVEKWSEVYMILFPDTNREKVPNPYYQMSSNEREIRSSISQYDHFLKRELPKRVEQQLRERIDVHRLGAGLKDDIVDVIRQTQVSMLDKFLSTNMDEITQEQKEASNISPVSVASPSSDIRVSLHSDDGLKYANNTRNLDVQTKGFLGSQWPQETSMYDLGLPWDNNPLQTFQQIRNHDQTNRSFSRGLSTSSIPGHRATFLSGARPPLVPASSFPHFTASSTTLPTEPHTSLAPDLEGDLEVFGINYQDYFTSTLASSNPP